MCQAQSEVALTVFVTWATVASGERGEKAWAQPGPAATSAERPPCGVCPPATMASPPQGDMRGLIPTALRIQGPGTSRFPNCRPTPTTALSRLPLGHALPGETPRASGAHSALRRKPDSSCAHTTQATQSLPASPISSQVSQAPYTSKTATTVPEQACHLPADLCRCAPFASSPSAWTSPSRSLSWLPQAL